MRATTTPAQLEARADELLHAMHMTPSNVRETSDIVVVLDEDGASRSWTLAASDAPIALVMIGGLELALAVAEYARDLEPNRVALVVFVVAAGWCRITSIGLRPCLRGGSA